MVSTTKGKILQNLTASIVRKEGVRRERERKRPRGRRHPPRDHEPHPSQNGNRKGQRSTKAVQGIQAEILGKYVVITNSTVGYGTKVWHFVNIYDSTIGEHCTISSHVEIGGSTIGDRCKIEAYAFIPPGCKIGNNVFIGPGVRFANDKYPNADPIWNRGSVTVKDNVRIGIGCIILPGVTIGARSFVAAGSLVTSSVGPDTFVMGAPAHRVHKKVFEDVGLR